MRVLVDTSAWIDFLNGHPSPEASAMARLIREEADVVTCGVVVAEVLQGLRRPGTRAEIEGHLLDMEWLTPREPETYLEAARVYRELRSRGITIRSTIDCLIATLAAEHDVLLLSKDRDLELIVESGLLGIKSLPVV
ncbi:MAG TPA: PIN domain nuclease [Candidatus Sulfomarinibacteraceae bacterium]|nr:PIN domain nuclease [Candidatus Sulfomarinibacteraceae bacterium]